MWTRLEIVLWEQKKAAPAATKIHTVFEADVKLLRFSCGIGNGGARLFEYSGIKLRYEPWSLEHLLITFCIMLLWKNVRSCSFCCRYSSKQRKIRTLILNSKYWCKVSNWLSTDVENHVINNGTITAMKRCVCVWFTRIQSNKLTILRNDIPVVRVELIYVESSQ